MRLWPASVFISCMLLGVNGFAFVMQGAVMLHNPTDMGADKEQTTTISTGDDPIMNEVYRPQFHFTARKNWLNDPNGLVYLKGEYHLFFQHNPFGREWGNMHWGHAVSSDLIHWQELPIALSPDSNGTCFSGSVVVDKDNTSGFKSGEEDVLVALYTGEGHGQCVAYSNDRGRSWTRYEKNPVIPLWPDRDPKVIWHSPTRQWIMALYIEQGSRTGTKGIGFFSSKNLKEWTCLSEIGGFYECPDLFPLPVDLDPQKIRWVVLGGDGQYLVGQFDGTSFKPESELLPLDLGQNFYATQTYSDIPPEDGRRIQIAWMRGGEYPGMPFNQQMTFPCELSLRTTPEGIRMYRYPVKEIEKIAGQRHSWKEISLSPGKNLFDGIHHDLLDIHIDVKLQQNHRFLLRVRGAEISYNAETGKLVSLGKEADLPPVEGRLRLRILIDRTSVELFGNEGRVSMSSCFIPVSEEFSLTCEGGPLDISQIEVIQLNPSLGAPPFDEKK